LFDVVDGGVEVSVTVGAALVIVQVAAALADLLAESVAVTVTVWLPTARFE
jgi:hypothetical protein